MLPFDLGRPDYSFLAGRRYETAFVCAAVAGLDDCRRDPVSTRGVNVDNTIELMRRLADGGTHMVFFSTSQVFDGTSPAPAEDGAANPRNEYGAQKLAVEQAITRYDLPAAILRVTKVLGERPIGTFERWRASLAGQGSITAASNLAISPAAAADVRSMARRLAAGRHRGIWHLGAADALTYVEAAPLFAESVGQPAARVVGEVLTEAKVPSIHRLRNERLACEKVVRTFGVELRLSRDVLTEFFARTA